MRLFTDQMIDIGVVVALRTAGYNVECTSEKGMARSDDFEILGYCTKNSRAMVVEE